MDGFQILIPLAPFIMVVAIVAIPAWLKSRDRREMQETLRRAIEKGQPLPPEVIESITRNNVKPPATAARDLRTGVIMLSVAIGMGIFGYAISFYEAEAMYALSGLAAIPGMIGLAFIVLSAFNKNKG